MFGIRKLKDQISELQDEVWKLKNPRHPLGTIVFYGGVKRTVVEVRFRNDGGWNLFGDNDNKYWEYKLFDGNSTIDTGWMFPVEKFDPKKHKQKKK